MQAGVSASWTGWGPLDQTQGRGLNCIPIDHEATATPMELDEAMENQGNETEEECPDCEQKIQNAPTPDPVAYAGFSDMYMTKWTCCKYGKSRWRWSAMTKSAPTEQPQMRPLQLLVVDLASTMPVTIRQEDTVRDLNNHVVHWHQGFA